MEQEIGEMHWSDGWMFKRLENGDVRIRKSVGEATFDGVTQPLEVKAVIQAAEWVSLIHHLGKDQTTGSFEAATALHMVAVKS